MYKTSEEMMTHLRDHVAKWPASKQDIIATCQNMSDITSGEQKWFMETLPDKVYDTPEDVVKALEMKQRV